MELLEGFIKHLIKVIFKILTYLGVSVLLFLVSFSFYTKKFPPDFKMLKMGYKNTVSAFEVLKSNKEMLNTLLTQDMSSQLNPQLAAGNQAQPQGYDEQTLKQALNLVTTAQELQAEVVRLRMENEELKRQLQRH